MKRRLAITFASAALIASVSTFSAFDTSARTVQTPEGAGAKVVKSIRTSCPLHPEVKAASAGKCPKCRMQERKRKSAQAKEKNNPNQSQGGTTVNE